jgi:thiamine biosynthesis lipoprotein
VIVDGVRYHHILDPATGYPARSGVVSVTILSKSGLLSDALSTACFVLGLEKGMELAQSYGVEALFVTDSGEMYMSENMDEYFTR